jgi:hypothetical protein
MNYFALLRGLKSSFLFQGNATERQIPLFAHSFNTNPLCEQLSQKETVKFEEYPNVSLIVFKHSYFPMG